MVYPEQIAKLTEELVTLRAEISSMRRAPILAGNHNSLVTNNSQVFNIIPFGHKIPLTAERLMEICQSSHHFQQYHRSSQGERADPKFGEPKIVGFVVDAMAAVREPLEARNVRLDPSRQDLALILSEMGMWTRKELNETTAMLCDSTVESIQATTLEKYSSGTVYPPEVQEIDETVMNACQGYYRINPSVVQACAKKPVAALVRNLADHNYPSPVAATPVAATPASVTPPIAAASPKPKREDLPFSTEDAANHLLRYQKPITNRDEATAFMSGIRGIEPGRVMNKLWDATAERLIDEDDPRYQELRRWFD